MEEQSSAQERRATFWITFLGPVAFGLMAGAVKLVFPWLSSDGASSPPAERFWIPALGGLSAAVLLQVGRWWLYGRAQNRQGEAVKTLCTVALLVSGFAACLAILLNPWALLMFPPLMLFIAFLLWWPRKKSVTPRDRNLGIYCICILSFVVSAASISMTLMPGN
ncbi:hypothetical protein NCCP1664_24570 [Zafaria cholistanensis]|uniref:Uncharacterized protein n=1 Tax=Zafaria cholistanensis TaxID=1682741 RepID=A0A5A7NUR6_9MICC|nr:hypothetical protein [Zafaria cholistanensis]GER23962.1 hypothetical protein NCCP1664_24570 [Zafaria cholistanensis]